MATKYFWASIDKLAAETEEKAIQMLHKYASWEKYQILEVKDLGTHWRLDVKVKNFCLQTKENKKEALAS